MKRLSRLARLALASCLLVACTPKIYRPVPQVVSEPDKVSAMLAQAADRASVSLQTLAAVEQARTPSAPVAPIDNAPTELRRAVTISWTGPVEPIARMLADRAGYVFQTLGDAPPVAVVVSVNVENKPVGEVLRDIGLQLGARADLKVDAARQLVEIHYAPVSGAGG